MNKPKYRDPKPDILRIEELVRKVKSGDIKLPKFQRPFVWNKKDVLKLLDSIYNGYPIRKYPSMVNACKTCIRKKNW